MAFAVFNKAIPVRRKQPGGYFEGIWQQNDDEAGMDPGQPTILGSVQPSTPSQVLLLPEGRRIQASFTIYTTDVLNEMDEVQIRGDWYEVLRLAPWENGILPHTQAIAVKKQREGEL
jgi:hypothetical protein